MADPIVNVFQTDQIGVEHRATAKTRETIAGGVDDVDVAGSQRDAFLKDQRAFVEKLSKDAGAAATAGASNGPVDFARMQRDPAYAQQMQQKLASMSPDEQMKFAMQLQQAQSAQAVEDERDA